MCQRTGRCSTTIFLRPLMQLWLSWEVAPNVINLDTSNPQLTYGAKLLSFSITIMCSSKPIVVRKSQVQSIKEKYLCPRLGSTGLLCKMAYKWISALKSTLRSNKYICNCGEPSGDVSETASLKTLSGIQAFGTSTICSVMPTEAIGRARTSICYCLTFIFKSSVCHWLQRIHNGTHKALY